MLYRLSYFRVIIPVPSDSYAPVTNAFRRDFASLAAAIKDNRSSKAAAKVWH
ncbi:MAG: hypothetical protein K6F94_03615 [Bacteroidaceae bacterium]|nr:hypothetical protein [Bacteroidaceae bacterium]